MTERITLYLEKLEGNPENLLNRFSLAQSYYENGEYEKAITHLNICFQKRNDWMMASLLLGKALLAVGQKKEACVPLEQTITLAQEQGHEDPEQEATTLLAECMESGLA
jgi:predicted negative regulator of RcsB-dependent stress response|tara:strand:- start:92 stop:418 length:327 start_codon:yes stop_codon:yes gene_type:complete